MPFVKTVKNKAYFKRYQVKFRRRREGKTDYRARQRLVRMDKNKYQSHRYRLVVRFTNTQVIAQIVYTELDGDRVLASAYSSELKRYGLSFGLKNYAAAYCTGLLIARRTLQKLGMDELYTGNEEVTGEVVSCEVGSESNPNKTKTFYVEEVEDERRPFRAVLDVGISTTSTGNRVFGALKGATDGGLDIPHSEKRFPGFDAEAGEFDADFHRARIFGQHVADYMREMQEGDAEKFAAHFKKFTTDADGLEALYTSVHAAIRADPSPSAKNDKPHDKKWKKAGRRNLAQRKDRVKQKKEARIRALMAAAEA
eukprot:CAMPEP_0197439080 /NCGR_PEP_ID=MMETSP1175-20131217/5892_1 /TAXON_ID=1003142 /ORGANISM="Triceratium dubium, Strain CCMP147" /LENGTH=310 /DNA_ID=CAMNT_0042968911 /DNA_START=66 /DNA_END=998 /DNA_ORIENTATION=-